MKRDLQRIMNTLYKQYVKRKRWQKVVTFLAAIVVFCTTYALVLPAITMESKCGMEEHTHTENCYEKAVPETTRSLVCTYESLNIHVHTSECYDSESNLLCGMIDYVAHEHNDDCMDENGNVVCQLPVIKAHEHTDACYQIPEVIESAEAAHVHDESCYITERGKLICQFEETEGYSHGESCYDQGELICERQEAEAHHHTDECYEMISVVSCGLEESVSAETTVSEIPEPELICNEPVVMEHVHGESCFVTETAEDLLTCTQTENHTHGELCYGTWNLVCGKEEHTHTDECQAMEGLGTTNEQGEDILLPSDNENAMLLDTSAVETGESSSEEEIEGTIIAEGMLTDTVWWKIVDDEFGYRTLMVGGVGPMPDFSSESDQPWRQYTYVFDLIEIKDGITYIGKSAFKGNRLKELKIGKDVEMIENYSFGYMHVKDGGEGIIIRIPGNVKTVAGGTFNYGSAFKEIIFEEGVESITGNPFSNETFYSNRLERVYFPTTLTNVKGFGSGSEYTCGVKSEFIVAENNPVLYVENGALYKREVDSTTNKEKITLIGYPYAREATSLVITGIDAIAQGVFAATTNLTDITILGTSDRPITLESRGLFECNRTIENITFNEHVIIPNGYIRLCYNAISLKKITAPDGVVKQWHSAFCSAVSLKEFTVTENVQALIASTFEKNYALEKLMYDAKDASVQTNIFGTEYYPRFDLVIGEHVNILRMRSSDQSFEVIASRAKSVTFVGENQITIEKGALKGAEEPLNNLSGTVWVDNQGVVYLYEKGNPNAKVVYVSPGIKDISIPETITVEGQVYSVNSIGANAFEASDTINLTIANPENFSIVEDYAFANCVTLNSINGETTVEGAKSIFSNTVPNDNAFIGTALKREPSDDENVSTETEAPGDIYVLVSDSTDADARLTVSTKKREYYTGEQAITTISLSNPQKYTIQNKKFRIYFSASDPDIAREKKETFNIDGEGIINPIPIYVINAETPGTYYFEIDGKDIGSSTFSFTQTHTYPSPDSDGGELKIWLEVYDDADGTTETPGETPETPDDSGVNNERIYQKLCWTTVPAMPNIDKNNNGTAVLTASDYNKRIAEVHNLSYQVKSSVKREIESGFESCGLDFVRSLKFEDTLTIPDGFYIKPEIETAIQAGKVNYRHLPSAYKALIYVDVDGVAYEICTIVGSSGRISNVDASIADGKLKVQWTQKNPSFASEITADTWTITYSNQIICANINSFSDEEDKSVIFHNDIKLTSYYTYMETTNVDESFAEQTVEIKHANVTLKKEHPVKPNYLGDACEYSITLENSTAFPYEDIGILEDKLDKFLYIKAEQLDTMFFDEPTGDKLNVLIKNCYLSDYKGGETAFAVDGSVITLSPENTGVNTRYQNGLHSVESIRYEIEIGWINDVLTMIVRESESNVIKYTYTIGKTGCTSIDAAMNAIGFFVHTDTAYEVRWDYKGNALNGNTVITHLIPANVKDSFMYLNVDTIQECMESSQSITIPKNYAYLYRNSKPQDRIVSANVGPKYAIKRESIVEKTAIHNGKPQNDHFSVYDQDVIEYSLDFIHYGNANYEVLPLTDLLSGAQVLLVPKAINSSSLGDKNLDVYGDEGIEKYYVLNKTGTYEKVWITETVCADYIEVTSNGAGDIQTLIKLYYKNLTGGKTYRKTLIYKALVSAEYAGVSSTDFSVGNVVWANDHQGHRLYYPIAGDGSIIRFEKDIVTSKGESPGSDIIEQFDTSIVGPGEEVTYRLKLYVRGDEPLELNGNQIYDALPNNSTTFTWGDETNPISISYYFDEGIVASNQDKWFVSNERPDGTEGAVGEQFLRWNDEFKIRFSNGNQFAYIYVTLTFPAVGEGWENYVADKGRALIYNTLYVNNMKSEVSHELGDQGKALLQKGIFKISARNADIATGLWIPDNTVEYISDTKEFYQNTDSYVHMVTYYTVLYNSGKNRLYINDLMDELPEGFNFESLTVKTGVHTGRMTTLNNTESESNKLVSISGAKFVSANVQAEVNTGEDGRQRIKFIITGKNVSYDEKREKYYLDSGEAIRFGYLVSTGKPDKNIAMEKIDAVNTIAMPYDNYMGYGVILDEETTVSSVLYGHEKIIPNNGNRDLWTNTAAGSHGFTQAFTDEWLASQVTLKKSIIKPGLIKTAKSRILATDGSVEEYEGFANATDTITWDVKIVNDGQQTINYYMISDMMEAPYGFTGPIGLDIYDGQDVTTANRCAGHYLESGYLFKISGRTTDENGNTVLLVHSNTSNSEKDQPQRVTVGTVTTITGVNISRDWWRSIIADIKVLVEDVTNENGDKIYEKLSLIFDGSQTYDYWFSIPKGGMALLNLSTVNVTNNYENRTYVNHAYITPLTQDFDQYYVTKGVYGNWNDEEQRPYIRNSALLTVSEGFYTIAQKAVFEANNVTNRAEENTEKNNILLQDQENIFTYELTVQLPDTQINYITLIDNLPYPDDNPEDEEYTGDTMAYAPSVSRDSKFTVQLAEKPNFRVTLTEKDSESGYELQPSQFEISYHTKHNGFTMEDKSGSGENWVPFVYNEENASWSPGVTQGVGSIRLFINNIDNDTNIDNNIIKNQSKVTLKFDAKIVGDAEPGEIAWNSFGYSYEVNATPYSSESDNVGVRVPAIPKLSKKLVTTSNKNYKADRDETFEFLIYSGNPLDLSNKTEKEIYQMLYAEERAVTYQQITVNEGASESAQVILNNIRPFTYSEETGWTEGSENWNWIEDATYTVFELPQDSNSFYRYKDLLIQGKSGNTFVYNKNEKCIIQAVNERKSGNLILMKQDDENDNIFLSGAVFALYSPLIDELMTSEAISKQLTDCNISGIGISDINTRISVAKPSGTSIGTSSGIPTETTTDTYYLASIQKTDSNGKITWKELYGEVYYIQELQAPAGYNLDSSLHKVTIDFNAKEQIVGITNEPGYALPESGGIGVNGLTIGGAALILTATAGVIGNNRKISKKRKKGGER